MGLPQHEVDTSDENPTTVYCLMFTVRHSTPNDLHGIEKTDELLKQLTRMIRYATATSIDYYYIIKLYIDEFFLIRSSLRLGPYTSNAVQNIINIDTVIIAVCFELDY